jgi:hypothetical protein
MTLLPSARSYLTVDDLQAGRYPGFSEARRLEFQYRRDHPEVSAVRGACEADV